MTPVQEKEYGVLKEVIKVIEDNGLHYCAIGGTCLGAIRHKGFIPWDDDVDITLPRDEYELFRTKIYRQLPAHLLKLDYDNTESYDFLFTKIHDSTTTLVEGPAIRSPERFTGAFVDVYPLDGRPNGRFKKKIWLVYYIFLMISNARRRRPKEKITSVLKLLEESYSAVLRRLFRFNFFSDAVRSMGRKYNITTCETAFWNGAWWKEAKKYWYDKSFETNFFVDTIQVPFEDISIRIPRRYHDYLTMHYGDYMQFPPESERGKWHDVHISDMGKPCAYYAKLKEEGNCFDHKGEVGQ